MKNEVMKLNHGIVREKCEVSNLWSALQKYFVGEPAWILFWEVHRVDFAWYDGEKIHWHEGKEAKYLIEARIFHETKECHIRKVENKFVGRILMENNEVPAQEVYKKISEPYMWGSIVQHGTVREERGMQYHLPCAQDATGFGYVVEQYYIPDEEDGMLKMLDYRMTKVFQEIHKVREYLSVGGVKSNG